MTSADLAITSRKERPKRVVRSATIVVWAVALVAFLVAEVHVASSGYVRQDILALQAGEAWRTGGWLSQIVLALVGLIPGANWQQTVLSLLAAVVAGLSFGILYDRFRVNGWTIAGAVLALVMLGAHAQVLYAVSAASRGLPLFVAFAALIPAIRQMEDVGDVQSTISFGLLMPLVLLAGPLSTPLVLPLALGAALADPDGRRDPRAFVAMLLVALLPTIIVACGVVGFVAQSGIGAENIILPYLATYGLPGNGEALRSLGILFSFAPVAIVPLLYLVWPNLPERRHVWSALAVVALPVYLAIARTVFNSTMHVFVPSVALLAAYVSWLCVVRLPFALRAIAFAMLVLSTVASWTLTDLWTDQLWRDALLSGLWPGNS